MTHIHAKKSLGQNWLVSESAIRKIVEAANITPGELVLEIGPGKGVLTKALLEAGAHVTAIEKDHRLIPELQQAFAKEISDGQLTIIEGDILELSEHGDFWNIAEADRADLPAQAGHSNFPAEKYAHSKNRQASDYKLVANIPYYITGEILRNFLETTHQPSLMVLMIQKEVAERIVARDKKESLLSISVKAFGTPSIVARVPAGAFRPVPNVDSAILLINNITNDRFVNIKTETFFNIVRQGFAQKRKLLKNNLSLSAGTLSSLGLSENTRAEDLHIDDWCNIARALQ